MTLASKPNPLQDPAAQGRATDLYAQITAIDRRESSPKERAEQFLRAACQTLGGIAGAVSIGVAAEEIELRHTREREGLTAWIGTLQNAALEARSHSRSVSRLYGRADGMPQFAVVACPIDTPGHDPFGGIALLVRCEDVPEAERVQLHLRGAALHAAGILARPHSSARRDNAQMSDIARVFTRAGQYRTIHQFAYAVTNAARQRFNCELAAMGAASRGRIRLLCISGLDHIKTRSPGVHVIEQAMGECLDAGVPVVAQHKDRWEADEDARHGRLHDRWRTSTGGASVMSIPIFADDHVAAVVSFRRSADQPFDADDIRAVQKLLAPLAGAVPLVARATRGLGTHTAQSAAAATRWALKTGSIRKRVALLAAISATAWLATASSQYRITTPAVVVAANELIVASPADGRVVGVFVRPGQTVQAGETLARLDTTPLELELAQLDAQIAAHDVRVARALAKDSPDEAAVARAERKALTTRRTGVLDRIGRATITAPVAGIVIGPDLAELPGRQIGAGEPMLSIAQSGSLAIELRIPESRVADIHTGETVRFASHARPETPGTSTLARVAPAAVQRAGKQVFVGEAALPDDLDFLRPGMEGVAMVEAGKRPNWWLATHRIIDAARLRFWIE